MRYMWRNGLQLEGVFVMGNWTEDQGDYDDGTEDSGFSQDFDMEPSDDGWLGGDFMADDDDD
ncbi:hypothetical protein ACSTK1_06260 [Vibrio parahaemolyticus]|uniref:hypothetical protein n=1 Tax=Vibrio parahaemolyticus TaxID=670 RepID=UPI001122A21C|nr:hypothetical protein [Vibrio parahaemolyticus]MBE4331709.1 hypothetical protein [Vibrio parahaemolyticus]MBE4345125.1 hypothetical protein [Vibrio parahaemolyticus]HCE3484890.1 hypothetical protein [Vibrio parahaemolyticus]HCE4765909.1 hypothetical protein [Vibrio parahaemolyticus]HCG5495056.1 hypothetical protein [Vibrio parahaemolyticus]